MSKLYLGLDIGTSAVKAVLIDEDGLAVASSEHPLQVSRPHPLWSEQDAEDWWIASSSAVAKLDAEQRVLVVAIGLSGQMHGATFLDEALNPLRPAILWNDGRSFVECRELMDAEPDFVAIGGNLVMPGFTAPKAAWLRKHEPQSFEDAKAILLPKDYVRLRMTGELASDMSDASGTLWMDVKNRRWHLPLLEACGLREDQMPTLFEGPEITGTLRPAIAAEWGMDRVPVVAGGGDNACGALGAGILNEGDALMSLGTSGVIFTPGDQYRSNSDAAAHAFCHALPNKWHLMSVMLSAASCLEWGRHLAGADSVAAFISLAESGQDLDQSAYFLPYLTGERTPHNAPHAAGVLFGLTADFDAASLAQAILEGVAFGLADGLEALESAGAKVGEVSVIGGGTRSTYWARLLAAALGKTLIYRRGAAIGPAIGAARLARFAELGGSERDGFAPPETFKTVTPSSEDRERLAPKLAKFRRLYQHLMPEFHGA